jgi:hypothetical protein
LKSSHPRRWPEHSHIRRNLDSELMVSSNTITAAHAEALLKATPPEQRTDVKLT